MYKRFWKRFIDTLLSLIAFIILSPLLLITALAVKLSSPGPVLFKQQRLGLHGKVFTIYKFRSMSDGAEHTGSGVYSGKGDPRVTKVGKLIRATSIDELPQFTATECTISEICAVLQGILRIKRMDDNHFERCAICSNAYLCTFADKTNVNGIWLLIFRNSRTNLLRR